MVLTNAFLLLLLLPTPAGEGEALSVPFRVLYISSRIHQPAAGPISKGSSSSSSHADLAAAAVK